MTVEEADSRRGIAAALVAYGVWGLLPIYFGYLHDVNPVEVVAQRILWSMLLIGVLFILRSELPALGAVLRNRRAMLALSASAAFIGINWLTYVWAVQSGHVLGASLGYFLNPLVNVVLGVFVLGEKLRRGQLIAVLVAAAGVALMATAALDTLWVSVLLAISFALYGLVRKVTPVPAMAGLGAETMILTPLALFWMIALAPAGSLAFGQDSGTTALLVTTGLVTTVPLVLFAVAAQRLPLATLGLMQFLAPTLQFVAGIYFFGETLNRGQMVSFSLIWIGLILFAADSFTANRRSKLATA